MPVQGEITLDFSHTEPVYKASGRLVWTLHYFTYFIFKKLQINYLNLSSLIHKRTFDEQTIWVTSKTGSEFFTASSDGTVGITQNKARIRQLLSA
jgi:hypothetical protein